MLHQIRFLFVIIAFVLIFSPLRVLATETPPDCLKYLFQIPESKPTLDRLVGFIEARAKLYGEVQTNSSAALQIESFNRMIHDDLKKLQNSENIDADQANEIITRAVTAKQSQSLAQIKFVIEKVKKYIELRNDAATKIQGSTDSFLDFLLSSFFDLDFKSDTIEEINLFEFARKYGDFVTEEPSALSIEEISSLNTYLIQKITYELKVDRSKNIARERSEYLSEAGATIANLPLSDQEFQSLIEQNSDLRSAFEAPLTDDLKNDYTLKTFAFICNFGLTRAFDRFVLHNPFLQLTTNKDSLTRMSFEGMLSAAEHSSLYRFKKMMHFWFSTFLQKPLNFEFTFKTHSGEELLLRNFTRRILSLNSDHFLEAEAIPLTTIFNELVTMLKKYDQNFQQSLNELLIGVVSVSFELNYRVASSLIYLLINHGAQVNAVDGEGHTATNYAGSNGKLAEMMILLRHEAVIDSKKSKNWNLLPSAVKDGKYEEAIVLLNHGADPNAPIVSDPMTNTTFIEPALFHLVINKTIPTPVQIQLFDLLISKGADPNVTLYPNRITSLLDLTTTINSHWARKLVENGAKFYPAESTLHGQETENLDLREDIGMIRNFVNLHGAVIVPKRTINWKLIPKLAMNKNYDDLEFLLSHGADPNPKDDFGRTALDWSELHKDTKMTELLLKYGARHTAIPIPENPYKNEMNKLIEKKSNLGPTSRSWL